MTHKRLFLLIVSFFSLILTIGQSTFAYQMSPQSVTPAENVFIGTEFGQTTTLNNVVIFIRFSDETDYQSPYSFEDFDLLYNATDADSLRDYYLEVSYGRLDITSQIINDGSEVVFYTDINPRSYYQPYDATTNPDGVKENQQAVREHALLKRAIDYVEAENLIDPSINLDINDDGDIDSLTFMVSGDSDDWNSLLWPHQWSLYSYYNFNTGSYDTDAPSINGAYAYDYAFNLIEAYDLDTLVGVIAHEMFHVLSAPDLYHYYDYDWLSPIGEWGLMDEVYGTPSHMLGYMKAAYGGWIDSVSTITQSGTYTLSSLASGPENLLRIDTGYSNEYVYLEFRQQEGRYESTLPTEGLLVYRVDFDYAGLGNADGYYDENGNPTDEIYLFRPDADLDGPPYVFSSTERYAEDGNVDQAALSQFNASDEMGLGTTIPMFHSDGSVMNITIENVVINGDTITFDVRLPGQINLVTPFEIDPETTLYLVDLPGLSYQVTVDNLLDDATAYYTLDGSLPDQTDQLVNGPITISNGQDIVTVALYENGVRIDTFSKTFTFASSIETDHDPYGNDVDVSWLIGFPSTVSYDLTFSSRTYTEEDYDYIFIDDGVTTSAYDGDLLAGETLSFSNNGLLIRFVSDEWLDDFYGFLATLDFEINASITLLGDQSVTIEANSLYEDIGVTYTAPSESYTVDVNSTVDTNTLGSYTVTYILFDEASAEVGRVTRTVHVVDTTDPVLLLNPAIDTIMEGDLHEDAGVVGIDTYDQMLTIIKSGSVSTDVAGTYTLTYTAVDSSGNTAQIRRIVTVLEAFNPVFTCSTVKTTYGVGETFKTPICSFGGNPVAPDTSEVDSTNAGTYEILYKTTYKGIEFTYVSYVFFVATTDPTEAIMPARKEEEL